jgi:DNA-binding MarR family transcriptional regulator
MPRTAPAASASDVDAFSDALGEFMRAVRRARGRVAARQTEGELSLSQFHLLGTLERAGRPLPVGELAIDAGVSTPTATRMLTALQQEGLVTRERDPADRRVVFIELTPAGRACVREKRVEVRAWRESAFAALSPGERAQAARLLTTLAAAIEDHA